MNILDKIIAYKKKEIESISSITPIDKIKEGHRLFQIRDFKNALMGNSIKVIAEIKRCSPSEKDIMIDAKPSLVAKDYEKNGASAISVLTDKHFFGGDLDFIQQVKSAIGLPVLRKDFIISEYQVWESFYAGADAILLIADTLDFEELKNLYDLSYKLGMHVLVEFHSFDSLVDMEKLSPEIIGFNCRDLKSMKTDIRLFEKVYKGLPDCSLKVAESGISNHDDLGKIFKLGYNAALIGTSLMKSGQPGYALSSILNKVYK